MQLAVSLMIGSGRDLAEMEEKCEGIIEGGLRQGRFSYHILQKKCSRNKSVSKTAGHEYPERHE